MAKSTKWHIGLDGTPKPCKAVKRCPLGANAPHFDSFKEADNYAFKEGLQKFSEAKIKKRKEFEEKKKKEAEEDSKPKEKIKISSNSLVGKPRRPNSSRLKPFRPRKRLPSLSEIEKERNGFSRNEVVSGNVEDIKLYTLIDGKTANLSAVDSHREKLNKTQSEVDDSYSKDAYYHKIEYSKVYTDSLDGVRATIHFSERQHRDGEITKRIGVGKATDRFVVKTSEDSREQIFEVYDNGRIMIYDSHRHTAVTTFTPSPERIKALYEKAGIVAPDDILKNAGRNRKQKLHQIDDHYNHRKPKKIVPLDKARDKRNQSRSRTSTQVDKKMRAQG